MKQCLFMPHHLECLKAFKLIRAREYPNIPRLAISNSSGADRYRSTPADKTQINRPPCPLSLNQTARRVFPTLKIILGSLGATEALPESTQTLQDSGADETSLLIAAALERSQRSSPREKRS